MPRKSIGATAMTDAERQARCRAAHAAGAPVIRTRRPADHRSRARRWHDTVAELTELQAQYGAAQEKANRAPICCHGRFRRGRAVATIRG
jgi:hypothetical protein